MSDDIKPKVIVTETDLSTVIPLGEPLDTAFKDGIKKGTLIMGIGQYSSKPVQPTGVNVIITNLNWRLGNSMQAESRLNRKPPSKPKIIRNGRYYTMADLDCTDLPRCFKFNTRRAAKKFFNKGPIIFKSAKQFSSVFGKPDPRPTKKMEVKTAEQALTLYGNIEKPFKPLSLENGSPYFKTQANIELMAQMGVAPDYLDIEGGTPFANKMAQANSSSIDELLKHGEFEVGEHFGVPVVNLVAKKDKPG